MDFGFTNDDARFAAATAWREAAIADGWDAKPSYASEAMDRMCKLERDGFVVRVASRTQMGKWKYQADVCGWAPDGLQIRLPTVYTDFELIKQQVRHCSDCNKDDVDTFRVSFAGRVCASCLPAAQKAREYPGWSN